MAESKISQIVIQSNFALVRTVRALVSVEKTFEEAIRHRRNYDLLQLLFLFGFPDNYHYRVLRKTMRRLGAKKEAEHSKSVSFGGICRKKTDTAIPY